MRNFREFHVYQLSMQFCKEIYGICKNFPIDEKFALVNQMERAAVSIPSNIAEGASRSSDIEFARFLEIAIGSAFELETQLQIAYSLSYIGYQKSEELGYQISAIQRGLNKFIATLKNSNKQ